MALLLMPLPRSRLAVRRYHKFTRRFLRRYFWDIAYEIHLIMRQRREQRAHIDFYRQQIKNKKKFSCVGTQSIDHKVCFPCRTRITCSESSPTASSLDKRKYESSVNNDILHGCRIIAGFWSFYYCWHRIVGDGGGDGNDGGGIVVITFGIWIFCEQIFRLLSFRAHVLP